jgi:DNA-binding LacI/PurR family transcriptional regulator
MVSSTDVAKKAGVSQATVSRVLNNPERVKQKTRQRVLEAMEELGYHPNLIARSLVTKHTKTIALITGNLKNGFIVETIDSIINAATKKGYKTMVFFEGETNLQEILDMIQGYRVDGILISTLKIDDPLYSKIESSRIPCMQLNRKTRTANHYVVLDNMLAGRIITEHLIELGHRRIANITGAIDVSTLYERRKGIEQALSEAGIPLAAELSFMIEPHSMDALKALTKLMNEAEPPTAILCSSDAVALIVMDTLISMDYRIPQDISLAGIDNISISSHHAIELTSVGYRREGIGGIAIKYLIDMIEGTTSEPIKHVLMPELKVRNTTAKVTDNRKQDKNKKASFVDTKEAFS